MDDPAWCSTCKHGPTRPEVPTVEVRFVARFEGHCGVCDFPIRAGQKIAKLSNDRYIHEECE